MDNNGFPRISYKTNIKRKRYEHDYYQPNSKFNQKIRHRQKKRYFPSQKKQLNRNSDNSRSTKYILIDSQPENSCTILFYRMSWTTDTVIIISMTTTSRLSPVATLQSFIWKHWKSASLATICWIDLSWWYAIIFACCTLHISAWNLSKILFSTWMKRTLLSQKKIMVFINAMNIFC